jgi:CTP:molybdopterin cytidylyltransferase MocA
MTAPAVIIFHRPAADGEPALVRWLAEVREELARRQSQLFERAGASAATWVTEWQEGRAFGDVLAQLAPARGGAIIFSSGAVPRLTGGDARRLVEAAASGERRALTNNRYSSDIIALGRAATLRDLPALPSDNALPRWLEERAGFAVAELPGRERLALDLDTPLDVCLATLAPGAAVWLRRSVEQAGVEIPRLNDLRAFATDPHAELLVFGRAGSTTLAWLEQNVRCRVRFLAEERGLRASSPLAIGGTPPRTRREPRATLSMLLAERGPRALAEIVASLADGALIDSRVLLAARLGADESGWSSAADRFNSDLHRASEIADPWLRDLTASAASAKEPILLGGHSLVGPGVRLVLGGGGKQARAGVE